MQFGSPGGGRKLINHKRNGKTCAIFDFPFILSHHECQVQVNIQTEKVEQAQKRAPIRRRINCLVNIVAYRMDSTLGEGESEVNKWQNKYHITIFKHATTSLPVNAWENVCRWHSLSGCVCVCVVGAWWWRVFMIIPFHSAAHSVLLSRERASDLENRIDANALLSFNDVFNVTDILL